MRLTETKVRAHNLKSGADEQIIFDEGKGAVAGLGLRIRKAGSRKWIFQYRFAGKQRRDTIGTAAAWTLEAARKKAREMRVKIDEGFDPRSEKDARIEAAKTVFSAVMKDYLDTRERNMKPRSFAESKRHLEKHWKPLHHLAIAGITRATVAARLREIVRDNGAVAADRARSTLSAMFAWAIGGGYCEVNPVLGTNKASEDKGRERVLSDAELVAVWNAAPDSDYGRIVKLLMLTGQRRDEIGSLRWSELDMGENLLRLPAERTKNSRAHDVPLSEPALAIINEIEAREGRAVVFGRTKDGGGYSGWSHSKAAMDEAMQSKTPWTLHDLRRTAATRMADLGVAPHVIEAILNHVSGHKAGVAGIYNRSTYAAEKRAALDLWAAHVMKLISPTNIVPLRAVGG